MSVYSLKPGFQNLLRPLVRTLARAGVTANQVTLAAAAISIAVGVLLARSPDRPRLFLLLPVVFFVRMALNAVDGMLAREFGQKSNLGAYLNELCDVVSDAVLYLPFAFLPHFDSLWVGAVIVLSVVSEMAGVLGAQIGASRRYDGPFGKSDRAAVFGALGLAIGLGLGPASWLDALFPIFAVLLILTIANRVRRGLAEAATRG